MSIDKKKFKRLKLLCRAHQLEEEMFLDLDEEYGRQFSKDFRKENEYLIIKCGSGDIEPDTGLLDYKLPKEVETEKTASGCVKKLHRALARVTHPDLSGHEEDFKLIQEAYEKNDVVSLFLEVVKRDIDVELTS